MSEQRTMTIARGLTRLKTIKAQLENITQTIRQYGAWNDKKKHPLGETNIKDIPKNLNQAGEKIRSLYQSFNDLKEEYIKIKKAIDVANMSTTIEVAGKTMTIHEALLYEREVADFVRNLTGAYAQSINNANVDVHRHNQQYVNLGEEAKSVLIADIAYLAPKSELEALDKFAVEFLTEIDGIKNEVNALTPIIVE